MCVCVECGDDDNDAMLSRTRRRVDRCRSSSSERRLSSLRDVQAFQSFLVGTSGETFWHLWLDIERARVIRDDHELTRCVLACQHKKAVLPQGNRAMLQVFFSVEVRQQHSLQV